MKIDNENPIKEYDFEHNNGNSVWVTIWNTEKEGLTTRMYFRDCISDDINKRAPPLTLEGELSEEHCKLISEYILGVLDFFVESSVQDLLVPYTKQKFKEILNDMREMETLTDLICY